MAIESEVIIGKLQSEGIDEKLAAGISFETEEALNAWVGTAKTFVTKPKAMSEYTADELKTMADKGELKNVQSLLDKIRTESSKKVEPEKKGDTNPELEALKAKLAEIQQSIESSTAQTALEKRDAVINAKTKGLEPFEVSLLKSSIKSDATEEDIDKTISDYRALMVKRGLKGYATEQSSGKSGLPSDWSDATKKFVESKQKRDNTQT